ncbi:MAG TPA: flagellar hook protein FlgE [Steroidobacteraceae bacterium]|nr:flagellar hook protein FlgE [Steroidobacteraceae bacterium]
MSFGIALSGLNAAQSDLNVTANNIANSQTTGFKSSDSQFSELFAVSPQGVSKTQIGEGVALTQVKQNFAQGNIETSGNSLDMALSGNGFFTVSASGVDQYTRAGSFQTDKNGFVVNSEGQNLQVYAPNANGGFLTTQLTNLQIPTGDSPPSATTSAALVFNLPAGSAVPSATPFSPANSASYNQSTSLTEYDSLGAAHTASMYFVAAGVAANGTSTWDAYEYIDGTQVNATPVKLSYTSGGALAGVLDTAGGTNTTAASFGAYTPATGAAAMNITFNFSGTTQYGDAFGVTKVTQNGFTTGQISGVSVSSTGVVQANYTNGQAVALGQVAVANFASQEDLQQVNDTNWVQTASSGAPVYGQAGGAGVGLIQSGSLEQSNVDITAQLVNMITAQRAFQANSEMVSTENVITQTVINIPNQQ